MLQDTCGAEGLKIRVGVVEEVGVVVDEQRLDVVEDEAELVCVFDRVQARLVLHHEGGSKAAHGGGVQHLTDLRSQSKHNEGKVFKLSSSYTKTVKVTISMLKFKYYINFKRIISC